MNYSLVCAAVICSVSNINLLGGTVAYWLECSACNVESTGSNLVQESYSVRTLSKLFAHNCSAVSANVFSHFLHAAYKLTSGPWHVSQHLTTLWKLLCLTSVGLVNNWRDVIFCKFSVWLSKLFFHSFIRSGYFYSTSSSPLLLRCAPNYSIDTVSKLTRWSATANCEWRICPRFLRGG